jgi:tetratricopeptide (TPR) repeat protein
MAIINVGTMNKDISDILKGWPSRESELAARKIVGDDGMELLQLRIDLGLIQMFFDGRPDGERPFGQPSLLDHLLRVTEAQPEVKLDAEMWADLDREVMQFYHRRRALLFLGARTQNEGRSSEAIRYFQLAIRDAEHNLQVMDFIKAYSSDEQHVAGHERYRSFVLMHRALAEAQVELIRQDPDEAIERLKKAQAAVQDHYRQQEQPDLAQQDPAMSNLRALEEQIRKQHKIEQTLHEQLALAIETEQFEKAAELRDRLRKKTPEGGSKKDEA